MYVEPAPIPEVHGQAWGDLASTQGRPTSDEQVDLQWGGLVNEVGARPGPNGPAERIGVDVEPRRQRGRERNHDVDIDRRAGLPRERTGDRPAYGVRDLQRVEMAHHEQRRGDRIDGLGHGAITWAASG